MSAPVPPLTRDDIAALIPHSGTMCLLAPTAIEYAAQAMALHGALTGDDAGNLATPGYLASARGVRLHRLRLDDLDGDLRVEVRRGAGDGRQILYTFEVSHRGAAVADGRATVVLNSALAIR